MSDRLDSGKKTSFGGGVSMKCTFGGGFGFSLGVGFGISQRSKAGMMSMNTSINIYNSGVGTRSGVLGGPDKTYIDFALSPALTIPFKFENSYMRNPAILNTFHNNAVSGVMNPYKNSASLGSNFVFNFNSERRNQQVGYFGFKLNQFDFNFYNDVIPLLGDTGDRWWTGGGSLNLGPFSVATDVFTGERDPKSRVRSPDNPKKWMWLEDTDNPTGSKNGTYVQTDDERMFNNGQTLLSLRNRNAAIGLFMEGKGQMWSQIFIHENLTKESRLFYSQSEFQSGIIGRVSGF